MGFEMDIGTIKSTSIETNQDSAKKFIMLEVEESEGDDLQDVQLVSLSGIKTRPEPGERVYILNFGGGLKIGICVEDNIETVREEGERDLYATDAGVRKSALTLKKDGDAVLNDGEDWAVQFTEMKAAFDELVTDFNTFVTWAENHVHPGVTAGTASTSMATPPPVETEADMSGAKISTVRVP